MNITNACSPAEDEGAVAVTKRAPGRGGQAPLRGCAGRGIRAYRLNALQNEWFLGISERRGPS